MTHNFAEYIKVAEKFLKRKNFKFSPQEIINECFTQGINNENFVKLIYEEVLNQYFKHLKEIQLKKGIKTTEKHCKTCNQTKSISNFSKIQANKWNYIYFRSKCNQCISIENKEKYKTNENYRNKMKAASLKQWKQK